MQRGCLSVENTNGSLLEASLIIERLPLLQRTVAAPYLWNYATGRHLQRMSSASSLLQNDDNGFLLVEMR